RFQEPHQSSLGIFDPGESPLWNGHGANRDGGAQRFCSFEIRFESIDFHVHVHVVVWFVSKRRDVALNSTVGARRDHGGGTHLVDLPAEELAVERRGLGAIAATNLKMNHRATHLHASNVGFSSPALHHRSLMIKYRSLMSKAQPTMAKPS